MGNESLVTLGIAFVSAGAAIAAVWAVINQTNTARFATGVDLLFSLKARFESREYRVKRGWAVAALSGKAKLENVQGVLDFFETIGLLVRRKTLDAEMLRNTNKMNLFVFSNPATEQARLVAVLDNLGKGAGGAAVQNLNLMLGLPETAGL